MSYTSDLEDMPISLSYDLNNGSPFDPEHFIILHFNINSILKEGRLEELHSVCSQLKVAVLVINESKLDSTIPDNLIKLHGFYDPLRRDRLENGRNGGGCLIYISEKLTYKHRIDLQSEHFEHLCADIKVGDQTFTITTYYRPPNETAADHELFLESTDSILSNLYNQSTQNKIIVADFNFGNCYSKDPVLKHKPLDNSAPDLFASFGYKQLIDIPTRLTQNTMSLIDLLFVQNEDLVTGFGTIPKIADHEGIVLSLNIKREN